jgi:hypothetical protein
MMIRTRWKESLAPIAKDLLRVGMWPITTVRRTIDPETGIPSTFYRYGSGDKAGVVVVQGELCEKDRGVFLIILAMDKNNGFDGVEGHISDLVKMKGVKNPYKASSIDPVWDSVERLLDVHVRIKPNVRGGSISTAFKLVTGKLDSDGNFFLLTHDYQKMIEKLGLYEINIPLPEYFSYKSSIARSIREFLRTQTINRDERGYEISLKKLCEYISYKPEGLNWAQIWQHIEKAINELKQKDILSKRCCRDKDRQRVNGGIVKFWYAVKKVKKNKVDDKSKINGEIYQQISKIFPVEMINGSENSYRTAFNKASIHLKSLKNDISDSSIKHYMEDYLDWLKEYGKPKYINYKLFLPDNTFFNSFEKLKSNNDYFVTKRTPITWIKDGKKYYTNDDGMIREITKNRDD